MQEMFTGAFPLLQSLQEHHNGQRGEQLYGRLPDDAVVFPGQEVLISPYYMNRNDPSESGVWAVNVGSLTMHIKTIPSPNGPLPTFLVREAKKQYRDASPDEVKDIVTLLGYVSTHLEQAA